VKEGSANLSIDNTFPHVVIIAHAMAGKPAFYIGEPCVLAGQGQEWGKIWPLILLFRMNELLDLYERLGVKSRIITICRNDLLNQSGLWLIKMIIHPDTPGRQFLTIRIIFRRFLSYGIFWKSLIRVCLKPALDKISPSLTKNWQN
jgi:hypothetical protein